MSGGDHNHLLAAMQPVLDAAPDGPLGVAVSGGGDSVALLVLLAHRAKAQGRALKAITIDHGLRSGSVAEAAAVATLCQRLGVAHQTHAWTGWDGSGNLQDAARQARRALIGQWAADEGVSAVALGHTHDDQAETYLMRLARGSGVDGLAAMAPVTRAAGVIWLRPMLGITRADLRAFLQAQKVNWSEDPSNADPEYARVRMREAMPALDALGLGPARLVQTAANMAMARKALGHFAAEAARGLAEPRETGELVLQRAPLAALPEETQLRIMAAALGWVSGATYRPRLDTLRALVAAILAPGRMRARTLHGCVIRPVKGGIALRRELAHVAGPVPAGEVWDGRWATTCDLAGLQVAALGPRGLQTLAKRGLDWRRSDLAREVLCTIPGFWREQELVACPLLVRQNHCHARLIRGAEMFFCGLEDC